MITRESNVLQPLLIVSVKGDAIVLVVRVEPELERRLDQLAQELGKTHSACIREAISQVLSRHGDAAEDRRQSEQSG